MASTLEYVIRCQQRLIAALDARDAAALETATSELSDALTALRANGAVHDVERDRVDYAMKQAQAARIRVNVLSEWTRQRIDRLAEVRSGPSATYGKRTIYEPLR
jgi:hypothetical protein